MNRMRLRAWRRHHREGAKLARSALRARSHVSGGVTTCAISARSPRLPPIPSHTVGDLRETLHWPPRDHPTRTAQWLSSGLPAIVPRCPLERPRPTRQRLGSCQRRRRSKLPDQGATRSAVGPWLPPPVLV